MHPTSYNNMWYYSLIGISVIFIFSTVLLLPAYAQSTMNKSVKMDTIEVPFTAFNVTSRNATLFNLQHEHVTNWQLEIENKLRYAGIDENAVIRLYDNSNRQKFVDIGMGGQPNYNFWVAVNTPEEGYFIIYNDKKLGWSPNKVVTVTHSSNGGLTVNVGEKTTVDNLDVAGFTVKDFAVYGMGIVDAQQPMVNGGNVVLSFLSGDPSQNLIFYMPSIVLTATVAVIIILLKTKKRTV